MEHMKKLLMMIGFAALAVMAGLTLRHYFMKESNVKVQSFCLGLCGQNADGTSGGGIGIGSSDSGPLIIAGPWHRNNAHDDKQAQNMDNDENFDEEDDMQDEE